MKVVLLFIILVLALKSEDNYLNISEYAKLLYQNPRGIGCDKCHGIKGEGMTIITTADKNITTKPINNLSTKEFKKAFKKKKKFMPTYYLSDDELAYIYIYLTKQKENK